MKKLLLLFTMSIIVLLAGCMADSVEPEVQEVSIHDKIIYSTSGMSYKYSSESDILYQVDQRYFDFVVINENVLQYNLSSDEQRAYEQLFDIMDNLTASSSFSYRSIDNYSSQDFKDFSDSSQIELTLDDIVTFNALKNLIPDIETSLETTSSEITKIAYIEKLLDRTLSVEEITALDFMQTNYTELYYYDYHGFDFKTKTLNDLLFEFETKMSYVPTESEIAQLQIAYDIVTELINH